MHSNQGAHDASAGEAQAWVCSVCTVNNEPSAEACAVCNVGQRDQNYMTNGGNGDGNVEAETPSSAAEDAREDQAASGQRDETQLPTVDANLLNELIDMGFVEVRARKALMSGIVELESAVLWIAEHGDDPNIDDAIPILTVAEVKKAKQETEEVVKEKVPKEKTKILTEVEAKALQEIDLSELDGVDLYGGDSDECLLWAEVVAQWREEERPCEYDWSTTPYVRGVAYTGQCTGSVGSNMRQGISIDGMVMLLQILRWDSYDISQRQEPLFYSRNANLSWNQAGKNGYDLCEIVIPAYLQKIGLAHLSLVEAILHGSVAELLPLQAEVGGADAFFSHVQARPVITMLQSLRQAETTYESELREDREATKARRKLVAIDFVRTHSMPGAGVQEIEQIFASEGSDMGSDLDYHFEQLGAPPGLISGINVVKSAGPIMYFVDYFCLRQGEWVGEYSYT
jgi:hypothetical protein